MESISCNEPYNENISACDSYEVEGLEETNNKADKQELLGNVDSELELLNRVGERIKEQYYFDGKKYCFHNGTNASNYLIIKEVIPELSNTIKEQDRAGEAIKLLKHHHVRSICFFNYIIPSKLGQAVQNSFSDWVLQQYERTDKDEDKVSRKELECKFQCDYHVIHEGMGRIGYESDWRSKTSVWVNGEKQIGVYRGWKLKS